THHDVSPRHNITRNTPQRQDITRNTSVRQNTKRDTSSTQQGLDEPNKWQYNGTLHGTAINGDTFEATASKSNGKNIHKRYTEPTPYTFNCSNIHRLILKHQIGPGISKQVFLARHERRKVAVKMVTRNVIDVISCMRNPVAKKDLCYKLSNMKLMKEILVLEELSHPNLLRMLGYCVRSEETDSTSLRDHGIITVHEYGLPFYISSLQTWPLHMRIGMALGLADLLEYFETSPLGSLRIPDIKEAHFLLCEGRIKLTDLYDVTVDEPNCHMTGSSQRKCAYGLTCISGTCPGYNAKFNIDRMNQVMFGVLLSDDTLSQTTNEQISDVRRKLNYTALNASELKVALYSLLTADPHVDRLSADHHADSQRA
ncbi:Extracellular tyrosine-protein kinase PKDCC, partial [Lamellibrachia satsuma]